MVIEGEVSSSRGGGGGGPQTVRGEGGTIYVNLWEGS